MSELIEQDEVGRAPLWRAEIGNEARWEVAKTSLAILLHLDAGQRGPASCF